MPKPKWMLEQELETVEIEDAIIGGAAEHTIEVANMAVRYWMSRPDKCKPDEIARLGRLAIQLYIVRPPFEPHIRSIPRPTSRADEATE